MITAMRKHIKSRAFKIVLWVCLLAVAGIFSVIELVKTSFSPAQWIAKINGTTISYPEFARKAFYQEQEIKAIRAQLGGYADMWMQMLGISTDPQEQALDVLTQQLLLDQAAYKTGLVNDSDLSKELLNDPEFLQTIGDLVPPFVLEQGVINPQLLRNYLKRAGLSTAEFEASLSNALKRMILTQLAKGAYYVPAVAMKSHFINEYSGKKFTIATISLDTIKSDIEKQAISDEEITSFYNNNVNRYAVAESRSGTTWTFDPARYGITITPEEVAQYYNSHQSEYQESPVQIQVRKIVFEVADAAKENDVFQKAQQVKADLLQDPASFAKRAQELSADKESAAKGGLVPFFVKGTQDKQREMAAFLLKNDGDISDVIKTDKGFEILQRVSRKGPDFKPLTAVESAIGKELLQKKFANQFTADARMLIEQARTNSEAVAEFVARKGGKKQSVSHTSADSSPVSQALFKIGVGTLTSFANAQEGVLVRLDTITPSYNPEMSAVKEAVLADMYQQRAQEKVQEITEEIKAPLAAGRLDEVKKVPGVTLEQTAFLKKSDKNSLEVLQRKGIQTGQLFQLEQVGSVQASGGSANGYVVRLDEVTPFDESLFEAKKDEIKEHLTKQGSMILLNGLVASLYRNATIKFNPSQISTQQ